MSVKADCLSPSSPTQVLSSLMAHSFPDHACQPHIERHYSCIYLMIRMRKGRGTVLLEPFWACEPAARLTCAWGKHRRHTAHTADIMRGHLRWHALTLHRGTESITRTLIIAYDSKKHNRDAFAKAWRTKHRRDCWLREHWGEDGRMTH